MRTVVLTQGWTGVGSGGLKGARMLRMGSARSADRVGGESLHQSGLDDLARAVARGDISRRQALVRAGGAFAVAALAGPAAALGARQCPPGRRACNGKCCAKGARCKK